MQTYERITIFLSAAGAGSFLPEFLKGFAEYGNLIGAFAALLVIEIIKFIIRKLKPKKDVTKTN